uniref:Circadian clock associated1 n=1 Tax=Mesembryanthemum crystallinum TaxID=3544 RepID=Q6UEI8_MESCR|nr:circadian clock associated1 [Mesembryanthemum crystallinum]
MEAYSSGEELVIKTRKPYTITKQRERWTEEEHNRFLEALKLYGRAWQRIEEHIGTKTAVQIRSHAQKFFSKLEKEALVKGVPIQQAIDIEIPPPRPKRKPSNPYPRKTGAAGSPSTQIKVKDGNKVPPGSSHTANQLLDLEKEPPPENTTGDDGKQNAKETCGAYKCSETFTLFQEAPSTLTASGNENSAITTGATRKSCKVDDPVPKKLLVDIDGSDCPAADGRQRNQKLDKTDTVETAQNDTENEMHAVKNFPRHTPVHILDGSLGACSQALSSDVSYQESAFHRMGIPGYPAIFSNPAVSAAVESQNSTSRTTNQQMFTSFHPPFTPFPNTPEDYSSFVQMSATFSSLIVSALLQNPAAHAAASFAASFWPCSNMENSANCPAGLSGGFPPRPMNTAPSMAAIAGATVAAATAWWAAHGLLPLCAPVHSGFNCPPASANAPLTNVAQSQATNKEREENNFQNPGSQVQQPDQELSEALQPQHSASKPSATSSSDSGDSAGAKMEIEIPTNDNEIKVPAMTEQKDSSKGKSKKLVDRSSCGSNTPSGSDVETDALQKNDKGKEEPLEPDISQIAGELNNRRNRIASNNLNDSWKEVSEGGRLAFQALFSRERLPQSFSPPQDVSIMDQVMNNGVERNGQNATETNEDASQLDLNSNTWESCSGDQGHLENTGLREKENGKDHFLSIGLAQGKPRDRRTGFKPYKRCSVEARESRLNSNSQDQEKCPKRIRLEGEAST